HLDRLALPHLPGVTALRRHPLLGCPRFPGVLAVHRHRPEPYPDPAFRWIRHHRALALDRAAGSRQPPRRAAVAAALLSALAGRTAQRNLLELRLTAEQPAARSGVPGFPRPS